MLQRSLVSHTFGSIHSTTTTSTTTSTMNPLNALFLAVALTPALVSAAPQPTFGALFRHKEQKKEEKKEKKGKDGSKDVVYIVRPSYEVHQTYQPITQQHHGYGAPVTSYGAYPVMASSLVGPQYGEPVEGYGYYA